MQLVVIFAPRNNLTLPSPEVAKKLGLSQAMLSIDQAEVEGPEELKSLTEKLAVLLLETMPQPIIAPAVETPSAAEDAKPEPEADTPNPATTG